jgi:hypothetical protein
MIRLFKRLFARRTKMPRCTRTVQYQQDPHSHDGTGIFRFLASDCERVLASRLDEYPNLLGTEDEEILQWLLARDESTNEVVDLPAPFNGRFKYIADDLIRAGVTDVFCTACGRNYSSPVSTVNDPGPHGGWITRQYTCPQRHPLLSIKVAHIITGN